MANFAVWDAPAALKQCIEVILSIEQKQSYCEILESVPAVFAKLFWNFHLSLSSCSDLAGNRQYITGLSIYYRVVTCFDSLYLKKSRSDCSVLGQNIDLSFGPNRAQLGVVWWSTLCAASRSRYLVNARNQAESTERSTFPPPHVEFCSVGSPRAGHVFEWAITQPIVCGGPWHHIDLLCICGSYFGALVFAAATCCARPRACSSRSVNIWMVQLPLGLSSRSLLTLLASNRMALTRECKSSSRITWEIEIFFNFCLVGPHVGLEA